MSHDGNKERAFVPMTMGVITVSDSRTYETDTSGKLLVERIEGEGHRVAAYCIEPDDIYRLRARLSLLIADERVSVVILTGGTGVTGRDGTPEAVLPLLDKEIKGFGEMFRYLSWDEIGTSTMQSRAFAGVANSTYIFCLPGSTGACATGWDKLIKEQLDNRTQPCNLAELMPRLKET
jgi:molybdenum cofactor biosynthesis protein B